MARIYFLATSWVFGIIPSPRPETDMMIKENPIAFSPRPPTPPFFGVVACGKPVAPFAGRGELRRGIARKAFWVSWSTWKAEVIVDCDAEEGLLNFGLFYLVTLEESFHS